MHVVQCGLQGADGLFSDFLLGFFDLPTAALEGLVEVGEGFGERLSGRTKQPRLSERSTARNCSIACFMAAIVVSVCSIRPRPLLV